ncbi:MAG: efflux RND transporter permease subunit [Calditrichaceae bacterium]|nr:efflux RND transporter permease subunit [Calditrichaceae bacterium]RQV94992.1 MAG: efflux RND transporter permease subunit [Calditrichota bacterium]
MIRAIIHRKTLVSMFFLGISFLGVISYSRIPVELLPEAELPFLMVSAQGRQELDPAYMEREAIIPLEEAIGTLEDIEEIESYADRRSGQIFVRYNVSADMKYAYLRLTEKIDKVKADLADDFIVQVFKANTEQINNMLMNLQVRGGGGVDRLRYIAEKEILDKLETIDGIAKVELFGGQEKSIEIIVNKQAMESYGITSGRLQSILASNNPMRIYAGTLESGHKKFAVDITSDYITADDLGNIIIDPEIPLYLKNLAEIHFGLKEETSLSRVNGKEAITIQLIRDTQVNIISLAHQVRSAIDQLNEKLESSDVEIVIETDTSETLEKNFDLIKQLALYGGILAVLILWFFLRRLRLVSVIALAIPISVLVSLNFFYFFGITLNSLTLVGMALAIGMLLDNSIVVLENIYRLYEKGLDAESAVVQGTKEVIRPIIASTLTTITVFLPFIFTDEYLLRLIGNQVGISIISALCVSLVVALFLIPMITHYYLSKLPYQKDLTSYVQAGKTGGFYMVLLKAGLRRPVFTILSAIILFFVTLGLAMVLMVSGGRETELSSLNLYITMPAGSDLVSTDLAVSSVEERLAEISEIQDIISQIYEEEAILTINLKENYSEIEDRSLGDVKKLVSDKARQVRQIDYSFDQPESSARFRGGGQGPAGGGAVGAFMGIGSGTEKIIVKGADYDKVNALVLDINAQLEELSSVEMSRVSSQQNRPEIHLYFDRTLMEYAGITLNDIRSELSAFQEETSSGITMTIDNEDYDVIITDESLEEKTIDHLKTMKLTGSGGAEYGLDNISRVVYSEGKGQIRRINQERQAEVNYSFTGEVKNSASYLEAARR